MKLRKNFIFFIICIVVFSFFTAACTSSQTNNQTSFDNSTGGGKDADSPVNEDTASSNTSDATNIEESEIAPVTPSATIDTKPAATPKPKRPEMSATPEPERKDTRLPYSRGVNLGNSLEAPLEGAWGLVIQDEWMTVIKNAGFDHIRLPVRWSAYADIIAPYTIDEKFFDRVTHIINTALDAELGVVLNVHHYEEMATEPLANVERLQNIWRQIGERFKDMPEQVSFELMNEPNGSANTVWSDIWPVLYDEVRKTNPDRWICVTNGNYSSAGSLTILQLPDRVKEDKKVFATFHFYEPFPFTHQNADWVTGSDAWAGTKWDGNAAQQRMILQQFDQVKSWAEKYDMPVYMGEFGAYAAADTISRYRWTDFCARSAEKYGYAWSYWEFAAGFGFYGKTSKKLDMPLLQSLIPETVIP